jgi:mRNA interferase MazF
MNRGEVWWVNFDPAVGSETGKTSPAVIVSSNRANANMSRVVVVPLTSNIQKVYICEALITIGKTQSKASADQIMAADKSRLYDKIGVVSNDDMSKLERAIRIHLDLL